MTGMINWDELDLPDYESPEDTKRRLDVIHRQILEQKGISAKPEKNSPGFDPTPYQARQVAVMSALGLEASDIALVLNIEEKMLKLYYTKELRVSHNLANAMVARVALQMAMSGRFPDMTKFWLTHRAKWKASTGLEIVDMNKTGDAEYDSAKGRLRRAIGLEQKADDSDENSKT